jgi:hypothetical protein
VTVGESIRASACREISEGIEMLKKGDMALGGIGASGEPYSG